MNSSIRRMRTMRKILISFTVTSVLALCTLSAQQSAMPPQQAASSPQQSNPAPQAVANPAISPAVQTENIPAVPSATPPKKKARHVYTNDDPEFSHPEQASAPVVGAGQTGGTGDGSGAAEAGKTANKTQSAGSDDTAKALAEKVEALKKEAEQHGHSMESMQDQMARIQSQLDDPKISDSRRQNLEDTARGLRSGVQKEQTQKDQAEKNLAAVSAAAEAAKK